MITRFIAVSSLFFLAAQAAPVALEEDFNLPFFKQETNDEKFERSDANSDKALNFDEFLHLESAYVEAKRMEFEVFDTDNDGKVSLEEFEGHFKDADSKSASIRTEYFGKIFEDFDVNYDMMLSEDELTRVLADRFLVKPRANFHEIVSTFDADHNGGLDLTEYMEFDKSFPFDQTDALTAPQPKKTAKEPGQKAKTSRRKMLASNSFRPVEPSDTRRSVPLRKRMAVA